MLFIQGDKPMSALEQECFASHMHGEWVPIAPNRFAAGYYDDREVPLKTIYVFPEMSAHNSMFSDYNNGFARDAYMRDDVFATLTQVPFIPALRYIRTEDGKMVTPGFFDSYHSVFFRWRGQVRDPAKVWFLPDYHAISPEVNPGRVKFIIDITMPEDGLDREPRL